MKNKILSVLENKKLFTVLFLLNILIGVVIFYISSTGTFGDEASYDMMAKGILQGRFSCWYFLPRYFPETLRTPGYPLFLAFTKLFADSLLLPKLIQFALHFITVYLCTLIIAKINVEIKYRNLFLLLLIPNIQVVYYSGQISAETLNTFFIVLAVYYLFCKRSIINALLIAGACAIAVDLRPIFLFFPFIMFFYFLFFEKKQFRYSIIFLFFYILLLVPFGLWNLKNHGKFKVTPLEGGAGVAYIGYWQDKLPDEYIDQFYWPNVLKPDMTRFLNYSKEEREANKIEFENQWRVMLVSLKGLESSEDSAYLVLMNNTNRSLPLLHNSTFTIARENLLWNSLSHNISKEKFYYLESRLFHFIRTYVTGINPERLNSSGSFLGKLNVVYPTIISLLFIFIGMLYVLYSALTRRITFQNMALIIILLFYFGILHAPFSIQSRYSIPVHLLILSLLSISLLKLSGNSKNELKS